jgi:hypothetical protein
MRVSKITIGRLYNLGSYEHVRYEISVEVPEGESADAAFKGLAKILNGLKPLSKLGIKSQEELERSAAEIERMRTMPVVDWERQYGHCKGTAMEVIERYQKAHDEEQAKTDAARERFDKARDLLDDLGGAAVWKDAKLDWDNDNDI